MPVLHHPPPEALWAYAGGVSGADEEVFVASHLTYCPDCRAAVATAEAAVAVRALQGGEGDFPAGVPPRTPIPDLPPVPAAAEPAPSSVPLPRPFLRRYGSFDALPFRTVLPGVRVAKLAVDGERRAFVMDFPANFRLPEHGHHGVERALVLRGAFQCDAGHYAQGDVSWETADHDHIQIDDGGRCTTFFVNDGPLRVYGSAWADRMFDWWLLR